MMPVPVDRYTRLSEMRASGRLSAQAMPDARLLPLIAQVSRAIDDWTGRHFGTVWGSRVLSTGRSSLVMIPDCQAVTAVEYESGGSWLSVYGYALLDQNLLRLPGPLGGLIRVTGAWGWPPTARHIGFLSADISASETGTAAIAGLPVEPGDVLLIEDEQLQVADDGTLVRGVNGTTAAAHSAAASVRLRTYPPAITLATQMQVSRILTESVAGFAGVLASAETGAGMPWPSLYPVIRDLLSPYMVQVAV